MPRFVMNILHRRKLKEMVEYFYPQHEVGNAIYGDTISIKSIDNGIVVEYRSAFELMFNELNFKMGEVLNLLPVHFYELWMLDRSIHPIEIFYEYYKKIKVYGTAAAH